MSTRGAAPAPQQSPPTYQAAPELEPGAATELFKQPATRSIAPETLVAGARGVYSCLLAVEDKCKQIHARRDAAFDAAQWQAVLALHLLLLDHHHDFLQHSHHPSASAQLRDTVRKYGMPGRLWRHGIQGLLDVLTSQRPRPREQLLAFLREAYGKMSVISETVPAFQDLWAECLGDLARCQMAVHRMSNDVDADADAEIWAGTARSWYEQAARAAPGDGRLAHHLAVVAYPDLNRQVFLCGKSLASQTPFATVIEGGAVLAPARQRRREGGSPFATVAAQTMLSLFDRTSGFNVDAFEGLRARFLTLFDQHIQGDADPAFRLDAATFACSQINSLFNFGQIETPLSKTLRNPNTSIGDALHRSVRDDPRLAKAAQLWRSTLSVALAGPDRVNARPIVHVNLMFLLDLLRKSGGHSEALPAGIPWQALAAYGNALLRPHQTTPAADGPVEVGRLETLARSDLTRLSEWCGGSVTLPEDAMIRGHVWSEEHLSERWSTVDLLSEDLFPKEAQASTTRTRDQRILWALAHIAQNFPRESGLEIASDNTLGAWGVKRSMPG